MPSSKRVFITGGTGLIGRELYAPLATHGFEPYVLTVDDNHPILPQVTWIKGNLFDETCLAKALAQIQPQYLLNLAWCTSGDYQTSPLNFDFVRAGLTLLHHFANNGGQRTVFAGTCMEYAAQKTLLKESDSISPLNLYARCKDNLHRLAQDFCTAYHISFGYGRIFYVYGRKEHPSRLTAALLNALRAGNSFTIAHAQLLRDYMYAKDIAAAFVALLDSPVQGSVNICTSRAVSLADYTRTLARLLGREDLLVLDQQPAAQPLLIAGDNTRLTQEVGFTPHYSLAQALQEIIEE